MKTSRFSDSQILAILKQAEAGTPVPEICREHGVSSATFYKWRSKYGGMDASLMARLKELEDENRRVTVSVRKDFRPSLGRKSGLHRHGDCLRRPRFALVTSFRPSKGIGTAAPNGLTAFRDALQVFSENPPGATPIGD